MNREGLVEILRTGVVPRPLGLWPGSLCEFLTLSVHEPNMTPSPEERRDQIIHLFASWVMLNAYARTERGQDGLTEEGDERRLLALTTNSLALGPDFVRAAAQFVSWAQSEGKDTHDSVSDLFYLFSRLVLSLASPDAADVASAPALYDKLVAEEQRVSREMAEEHSPGWPAPAWLFGLYDDFEPESVRRGWVRAAVWALDHLRTSGSAELNPGLVELKERLAEQKAAKPYDPC